MDTFIVNTMSLDLTFYAVSFYESACRFFSMSSVHFNLFVYSCISHTDKLLKLKIGPSILLSLQKTKYRYIECVYMGHNYRRLKSDLILLFKISYLIYTCAQDLFAGVIGSSCLWTILDYCADKISL